MTETVSNAIARRENGTEAIVKSQRHYFAGLLPSHIKTESWMGLAVGVLRRDPKVAQAAAASPDSLLNALLEAARLGLEPGTEQYYLRPIKRKGRPEVQGIVGYQGIVELIYRAGAVSSVIVEVVRERDTFRYVPGRDERPIHEIDWFADDRGPLKGVYAYAVMKDGATSKVVVLNHAKVMEAKAKSDSADSEYSPWQNNEEAMWLKTAVRRLSKWVPTSAEYMREQLRAAAEISQDATPALALTTPTPAFDTDTGEFVEGELVDDTGGTG